MTWANIFVGYDPYTLAYTIMPGYISNLMQSGYITRFIVDIFDSLYLWMILTFEIFVFLLPLALLCVFFKYIWDKLTSVLLSY